MTERKWDWRAVAGYFVIVGAFLAWEFGGLRDRKDAWPPLTEVLKKWLPKWALSLLIGAGAFWALQHFTG